jgi:peroxiredoxin Q/BCP
MGSLEGERAPAFTLEGNDGKKHSLEDYRGKTLVLYFYPKDDTPGCTKEACGFRDLGASLKKSGAVVLESAKIPSIRSTVVIDPKGKVVKHWPTIKKTEDHPEEVLEFLKENL